MEASAILWIFGGTLAGNVLMSLLGSWYRAIVEVRKAQGSVSRWPMFLGVSIFNAGPWALVGAAIFTYYEMSAPWAPWFFGGVFVWIMFVLTIAYIGRKKGGGRRESEPHANS